MRRATIGLDAIHRAHMRRCAIVCRTCGNRCKTNLSYNHRGDCCGEVTAHILVVDAAGQLVPHVVLDPHRGGYCLDPTPRTTRPAWAPEPLPVQTS